MIFGQNEVNANNEILLHYRDSNFHLLEDSNAPLILAPMANGTPNYRVKRGSYYPYQPYGYQYSYSTGRGYGSGYGYGTRYGGYDGCYNCYYPRPGRRLRAGLLIGGAAFTGGLLGSRLGWNWETKIFDFAQKTLERLVLYCNCHNIWIS